MHTKPWHLFALLFVLNLSSICAFASEADELRAKAMAIRKEAATLAERGQREQAERLEREAQVLLRAAQQQEAEAKQRGDHPAAQDFDRQIQQLKGHLQMLLARERELRESRAPEPQLAEVRGQIAQVERQLREFQIRSVPHENLPPELHDQAEKLHDATRRIQHVRIASDNLRAAGMHDLAAEATKWAEAMEREVQEAKERLAVEMKRRAEPAASGHEARAGGEAKLLEEIERLRAEVRELRQKIEQR